MEKTYENLRILCLVLKVLAYIVLVIGIVAFITLIAGSSLFEELTYGRGTVGGIISLIVSLVTFAFLFYISELGLLFIKLDEHIVGLGQLKAEDK